MNVIFSKQIGEVFQNMEFLKDTSGKQVSFFNRNIDPYTLSILVENAGVEEANGIYFYVTDFEGKPYYTKENGGIFFIVYLDEKWNIFDFNIDLTPLYFSLDNTLFPWEATNWTSSESQWEPAPQISFI